MQYTALCNAVCVCVCVCVLGCGAVCRGGGWIINAVLSLDPTCSDYWAERRPFHGPAEPMPMIRFGGREIDGGWRGGAGGGGVGGEGGCCRGNELENQFSPALPSLCSDLSLSLSFALSLPLSCFLFQPARLAPASLRQCERCHGNVDLPRTTAM